MSRSVVEWVAKHDDEAVPTRVRLRVLARFNHQCSICYRSLYPGDKWICDHEKAIILGGENRESNLVPLCSWCDKCKTARDVALKSASYKRRASHAGIRKSKRSFPTNKNQPWKRKINGELVRR